MLSQVARETQKKVALGAWDQLTDLQASDSPPRQVAATLRRSVPVE